MPEAVVEVVMEMAAGSPEGLSHREMDLIKSVTSSMMSGKAEVPTDQQLKLMSELSKELEDAPIPKARTQEVAFEFGGLLMQACTVRISGGWKCQKPPDH